MMAKFHSLSLLVIGLELFIDIIIKMPRLIAKDLIILTLWLYSPAILSNSPQVGPSFGTLSFLLLEKLLSSRFKYQKANHDAKD